MPTYLVHGTVQIVVDAPGPDAAHDRAHDQMIDALNAVPALRGFDFPDDGPELVAR